MRGATNQNWDVEASGLFQSTPLMRGATAFVGREVERVDVSIHAPHARGDGLPHVVGNLRVEVSIHAPHARGDSLLDRILSKYPLVSIHAPHARGDDKRYNDVDVMILFQSTPLMRGATTV